MSGSFNRKIPHNGGWAALVDQARDDMAIVDVEVVVWAVDIGRNERCELNLVTGLTRKTRNPNRRGLDGLNRVLRYILPLEFRVSDLGAYGNTKLLVPG